MRFTFDDQANPAQSDGSIGATCGGSIPGTAQFVTMGTGHALAMTASTTVDPSCTDTTFDISDTDFSLRARFRSGSASGNTERFLVSKRKNGDGVGYALLIDPATGHAIFRLKGGQQAQVASTMRVDDPIDHDVLAVRQGGQMRLYVDGLLDATASIPTSLGSTNNNKPLTFGRPSSGGGTGFTGSLDVVAIYNLAVTPTQVNAGPDCNGNLLDDTLEIASGQAPDCNGDNVIDTCQGGSIAGDCNQNGICDEQELAQHLAPDVNNDGTPDDCQSWPQLPFGFDSIVFFGDSLSDIRNFFLASLAATGVGHPETPPYFAGHFSNGRMWVEYLTGHLGIPLSAVRNYAFGGATSGSENVSVPGTPAGLTQQLERYYQEVATGAAPVPTNRTLFVVWIGGNDFYLNQQLLPTVPNGMANIENALRGLSQHGARHFLVPNLPDLGGTPVAHSYNDPAKIVAARTGTIGWNANLKEMLGRVELELGTDIVHYDVFDVFERIVANPAAYGFTDVIGQCYDPVTHVVCGNPSQHVFWDWVHPTTNAHRFLALGADAALLSGGVELPGPTTSQPRGVLSFLEPVNGSFTTNDSITVSGKALMLDVSAKFSTQQGGTPVTLDVNGISVTPNAAGLWSVSVPLDLGHVDNPIVATLRRGEAIIDRERVVVYRGPSIANSTFIDDAVVVRLTRDGVNDLVDELMGYLIAHNQLNLRDRLLASNPLSADWGGIAHVLNATNAGYLCSSLEIVPMNSNPQDVNTNGKVFVRFVLNDLWIDYAVHGWIEDVPDPGVDCGGRVSASRISFSTELAFSPAPGAGRVAVTQIKPLSFDLFGFSHTGGCAGVVDFINQIPGIDINIEQKLRQSIQDSLNDLNQSSALEEALESIFAKLKVAGPLGGALGVNVRGDVTDIDITPSGAELKFRVRFMGPATAQKTFAPPASPLGQFGLDPVSGEPYDFALNVALSTLNQLLQARPDLLPQNQIRTLIDVGSGPQVITAELVAALIPAFHALAPSTPLELRVQTSLPPMLMGHPSSQAALSDLYIGQVLFSIAKTGTPNPYLTVALDLRGDVSLGYDAASSALGLDLQLAVDRDAVTIIANSLQANEADFLELFDAMTPMLLPGAGSSPASFPLPSFEGLHLGVQSISSGSGYVTAAVDLHSDYAKPDIIVESIDPNGTVNPGGTMDVNGGEVLAWVKNIGAASALGSMRVAIYVSPDAVYQSLLDPLIAWNWVDFGTGLQPGQRKQVIIHYGQLSGIPFSEQTLFVRADMPTLLDGTPVPEGTGMICERTETNNVHGIQVMTSTADSHVISVTPPTNVVGGIGPRTYRVRVGRNLVGPPVLHVPVGVAVGFGAGSTYGEGWVDLAPGAEADIDVAVLTPASFGTGGQVNQFSVTACTHLTSDSNWTNNCVQTSVGIAVPYWDLRFSIVNDPASARRCSQSADWDIRVTNVGNIDSMNVCALSGIQLHSGTGNWNASAGNILGFTTPNIAPGASWTYHVTNYGVYCGALLGTQYIKAEINYSAHCFDNFSAGNYDQETITITN